MNTKLLTSLVCELGVAIAEMAFLPYTEPVSRHISKSVGVRQRGFKKISVPSSSNKLPNSAL